MAPCFLLVIKFRVYIVCWGVGWGGGVTHGGGYVRCPGSAGHLRNAVYSPLSLPTRSASLLAASLRSYATLNVFNSCLTKHLPVT